MAEDKKIETPSVTDASQEGASSGTAIVPVEQPAPPSSNKALWMGTAVGIGSAAIVAALLYSRRKK